MHNTLGIYPKLNFMFRDHPNKCDILLFCRTIPLSKTFSRQSVLTNRAIYSADSIWSQITCAGVKQFLYFGVGYQFSKPFLYFVHRRKKLQRRELDRTQLFRNLILNIIETVTKVSFWHYFMGSAESEDIFVEYNLYIFQSQYRINSFVKKSQRVVKYSFSI